MASEGQYSPEGISYVPPGQSSSGGSFWAGDQLSPETLVQRAALEELRARLRGDAGVRASSVEERRALGRERQLEALARGRAVAHANRQARIAEEAAAAALEAETQVAGRAGYGPLRP